MPFQIIRNDITKVRADVIVNTANPKPVIGSGTDSAIYAAAGAEKLLASRRRIGEIAPGSAAVTPAFHLHAKHIIHTVGPAWVDGNHREREILRACYANSLSLAGELKARSIAFPLIATGVYGFPKDEALNIAITEIGKFLQTNEMNVILVVFDRSTVELSAKLAGEIDEFIDDHEVAAVKEIEYGSFPDNMERRRRAAARIEAESEPDWRNDTISVMRPAMPKAADTGPAEHMPLISEADEERVYSGAMTADLQPDAKEDMIPAAKHPAMPYYTAREEDVSLDDMLKTTGETFQQRLLHLIDDSGMSDSAVYKKANIDRRVFSKMRSKKDYRPKKETAVAFAIALELDMETTEDLLARAGIAFSPSDRFDLIVQYFVIHRNYDIFEINAALFKYGQPILGAVYGK